MTEDTAGARHSTPRRLKRILRSDLETIVLKALKKAPSERYVSAGAMAQDVKNYLAGLPVSARPDSIGYRCKRFVTRHKLQVGAASVAALAILGGATLAASEASKAAIERDNAVALASRNAAMSDFMRALIAEAGLSKEGVTVKELLERSEKLAMADSRERNEDRAAILGMLAELSFSRLNGSDAPVRLMDRALAVLGDSRDTNLRAWLVCSRAELVAKGDAAQLEGAQRAILHELDNPRLEPMTASICALNMARFAESTADGASAVHYAHAALEYFHQGPRQPLVDEARLLADLGRAYVVNGENQLADGYYAQAMAKFREAGRETSASANVVRMNWARVSSAAGVPKRALEMYESALAFYTENDPGAHQPILLYNRARVLDYIGRFDDARAGYEAVMPLVREMNNVNQEVGCLMGLASISEQTGDWPNARRYLDEVSRFMTPARLAADDSAAARLAILEGTFDLHEGRAAAGREKFEQALARKGVNSTKVHASIGRADALLQAGDILGAVTEARSALSMATSLQGGVPYSVFTGSSWLILGRALEAHGDRAEAQKAFMAAVDNLSNTVDASHPQLVSARQALAASNGNG
jgi:serine/threonine-protein kinase